MRKGGKTYSLKIAEQRELNRGEKKIVSSGRVAKVDKHGGESTRVGPCWEPA